MRWAVEAPASRLNSQIFNVGPAGETYGVREIAEIEVYAKSAKGHPSMTTAATV